MNPPMPVPCPSDAPKLMLPVCFSSTRNVMSTSVWVSEGTTSGVGIGCWKNPRLAMFCHERMSASRLNTWPGYRTMASRMTRSWVTSLPTMLILLTVTTFPSRMFQRRSTTGCPSAPVRRISSGTTWA